MPLQYWDATGRRAAAFGRQDGRFEAWVWPIKVLHGFRLEFRQDGMPEPVRGEAWLQEVITRPESTTLVYVHPKFTVREIVWAAPNNPALIVLFDIDSEKPLNITAKFVPDFKPMWPASLGGQHSWWLADDKAFGLGEALEKHVAMIGSPAVAAYTDFMDHSLIGGEMLLGIRVTPEQAKSGLAPLVIALGMDGEKQVQAAYREAIQHVREWYEQKVADWKKFLAATTQIETPDPMLNRAFDWAKVAMNSGWVCHDSAALKGCGMVAGYGPAGDGERPGFAWWFGGDGLLATWAMEDYGDVGGALDELRFLRARQNPQGKMMHEMVQSLDLVDWFGQYHFAYMHADTTPMYLYSIGQYWQRTGDRKFLEEFWPSAKKAYEWCVSVSDPADGLMDNTKAGLGAIEVGVLRGKVTKDVYLEGFWVGGLQAVVAMANELGEKQLADDADARLKKALKSLETQWWDPQQKYFAFGITAQGERAMMAGNWPAVMASLSAMDEAKARAQMERMAEPDLATDWGIRGLSDKSPLYDAVSYNNGTVWPYANTFVSWAQYRWGLPLAGYASLYDTANVTGAQSPGYMPEHLNGTYFEPGERSVPHQLFSSVGVIIPMMRGLVGIEGNGDTVRIAPHLPANWEFLRFKDVAVPGGKLSGEVRRQANGLTLTFQYSGTQPLIMEPQPEFPLGATVRSWRISGGDWKREERDGRLVSIHLPGAARGSVTYEYEGGVQIVPPTASPDVGARTSALKIVKAVASGREAVLTVAGLGGRTYGVGVVSSTNLTVSGATAAKTATGYRLEVPFEGQGYVTREIRLRW